MKKPSLTFLTNMPTPYQLDFFGALTQHFFLKVIYFTDRESDRLWNLETSNNYKSVVLKNNWLAKIIQKRVVSFHFSNNIIKALKNDDADITIVNGTYWTPNVILTLAYCKFRNKKVFFYGEPLLPSTGFKLWIKKNLLFLPISKWSDAILAIGKNAVESYTYLGYKREIYNVPYNINVDLFEIKSIDPSLLNNLRLRYKKEGEIIFLSSGALIARKGMSKIIEAFKLLPENVKARLLIIGEGPERNNLESIAKDAPSISLLGFKEKKEIPAYFALADVFVFASQYDGWGLVINEAIAAKKAIICSSQVGAAADLLTDNHDALIVNPEDLHGYASAMKKLIDDDDERARLVRNGSHAKISSSYNARKVYDIFTELK